MNWIYHIRNERWFEDKTSAIQNLYLRPRIVDDNNELLTGKIIDFSLMALKPLFERNIEEVINDEECQRIYHTELTQKSYCIQEDSIPESEKSYYLNWATIYIVDSFDRNQMLNWVRIYFAIKGYPCENLEQGTFENFAADTDPFMRMFSIENVKKYEPKFGKEWWKNKADNVKPSIDNELIAKLLNEINNNN
jgi:hypothetical protein